MRSRLGAGEGRRGCCPELLCPSRLGLGQSGRSSGKEEGWCSRMRAQLVDMGEGKARGEDATPWEVARRREACWVLGCRLRGQRELVGGWGGRSGKGGSVVR